MLRIHQASNHWFRLLLLPLLLMAATTVFGQTTTFTYQGRLTDGGTPANGNYDFQFALFDTNTVGTGTQQGSTVIVSNVLVTSGVFVVQLDFGSGVFSGANRFIEIAVKQTSASTFTTLSPRQPLTSTPYSIRSLNATTADGLSVACVSCITSSQIQSVSGSVVSGTIPVASLPAGSGNYIQNTKGQQSNSTFNISGNGTAGGQLSGNIVNATTQYNIGGSRVLSVAGVQNTFAGAGTGAANTGSGNAFFGTAAGLSNMTGSENAFFGSGAGQSNTAGVDNSFFGDRAGQFNTTGLFNAFFGHQAGQANTTGSANAFFGHDAGFFNTTGSANAFFGSGAGPANTTGGSNSFFGQQAGLSNMTGGSNSFFGMAAGLENTTGFGNTFVGVNAGITNGTGSNNTYIGSGAHGDVGLFNATAIGYNAFVGQSDTMVLGTNLTLVAVPGRLRVESLAAAGNEQLCRNLSNQISTCSSSLRYKTAVRPFLSGLEIINRLRPITFTWKQDGTRDLGLGAEDVAAVEPLLVIRNDKGEVEGVKYDHLNVVLINALKEQQVQIEEQRKQIQSLRQLVCLDHPHAHVCK